MTAMPYPDIQTAGIRAIVFPDPVVKIRDWVLAASLYERVYPQVPADFKAKLPFLVVRESGGAGVRDLVYARRRLQLECWAGTSAESSSDARRLAALILVWDEYEDVWTPSIIQDPTDQPDPDSGTPVHRLAAEVSFVGEEEEILSTEGE